jgi:hypothetical protein
VDEADVTTLRHQVMVLQRQLGQRPKPTRWDRLLFVALYRVRPEVLRSLTIVRPGRRCAGTGRGSAFYGGSNPAAKPDGRVCRWR